MVRPLDVSIYHSILCCIFCLCCSISGYMVYIHIYFVCLLYIVCLNTLRLILRELHYRMIDQLLIRTILRCQKFLTYITQWSPAFNGRNDGFLRQVSLYSCNIGVGRLHSPSPPLIFNLFQLVQKCKTKKKKINL